MLQECQSRFDEELKVKVYRLSFSLTLLVYHVRGVPEDEFCDPSEKRKAYRQAKKLIS